MKLNIPAKNKKPRVSTHEGAQARNINAEQALRRSVMSCMLWEDEFYEDGQEISARISELCSQVSPQVVSKMAIEARTEGKLRHVPLLLCRALADMKTKDARALVRSTLKEIIQRPDELGEFLAIYWRAGRCPVSKQVRLGLADACHKFSEYQWAKYDRDGEIKLRDVLRIARPKPSSKKESSLFKKIVKRELTTPDTWEVELSAGKDKLSVWNRLLSEKKLGALALLRNLRNMKQASVPTDTIRAALSEMSTDRVLPYRFVAAARYAPEVEPELEKAMYRSIESGDKLPGRTTLLIDVSGSMDYKISDKSEMTRIDAACGLAILAREMCETVDVYTFSSKLVQVPARRGFALRDAINKSQQHGGTELGSALSKITDPGDRIIVFTDEQSHDNVGAPKTLGYMVNVASAQHGVGYGPWHHIDGFSESIFGWIMETEKSKDAYSRKTSDR